MTDEDVLNKAIELLRAGWARGVTHRARRVRPWRVLHSYCATGAVNAAIVGAEICDYYQSERLVDLLDNKTWEVTNHRVGAISVYNDLHAEDVEDVVKIFEKVRADL